MLPAMAGANLVYGLGMFETGVVMDYGQLVMDNEFAGLMKHMLQGIPVNDETLALDVIHEVGPFGEFMSHEHTLKHMYTAQTHPQLIDRKTRSDWETDGKQDIYEKSWEKARYILKTHQPEPLPEDVQKTIRAIVEESEEKLEVYKK
jgi:trimethylamine--corrinoid protein Co-methyltransferase